MAAVPDHSLARTAVFAMGFGTGADVDYATLAAVVAKGSETLTSQQVFHGENAGTLSSACRTVPFESEEPTAMRKRSMAGSARAGALFMWLWKP